jgi:hypothetical protein
MKTECSEQKVRALKLKSHFAAGALGDSIRFGILKFLWFINSILELSP